MRVRARRFAGDPLAGAVLARDEAIVRQRKLERHQRNSGELARKVAGEARATGRVIGHGHVDPGGLEPGDPAAARAVIGIADADHRPRDPGGDGQVRASRAARAVVRAGLQCHIQRRAARRCARLFEGDGLGMGPPAGLRPAAADHLAMLDEDRADRGIGPAQRARAQRKRRRGAQPARIGGVTCRQLPIAPRAAPGFARRSRHSLSCARLLPRRPSS